MKPEPGLLMAAEIAEQPEVLARLLAARDEVSAVAGQVRRRRPRFVLLAARGTSDNAALYAKYLVENVLGLPAGLVSPSTITGYGARPDLTDVLWLAVSQSGGSPDLVESTRVARERGATTLAVTNAPESALARVAELHLDVLAGPELSVAATKTYTAQLLALWLFVRHWGGAPDADARHLPDLVGDCLAAPRSATQAAMLAEHLVEAPALVTTGRGYSYPTAREAALKLMETSYVAAQAFSGADLLHGPFALVQPGTPVLAVLADGVGARLLRPVVERLRAADADLMLVGPSSLGWSSPGSGRGGVVLALPEGLEESLAPLVQIPPLQEVARRLAVLRGNDPDRPRGLRKVTETV